MSFSTRLKYIEKESIDAIDIIESVPFTEFIMESLAKKVSAIPVWKEYEYSKQFELVLNFLDNKLETEFVDVRMTDADKRALAEEFLKTNNGFGLLDRFLAKPEVSSVMVNSYGAVYVQAFDEFKKTASVLSENQFYEITARFRGDSPIIKARQGNLFITILKPPVSDNMIIIKKIKDVSEDLSDLPNIGQITAGVAAFFKQLLNKKKNIIISGNTQAGICEFIQILQNSLDDIDRVAIIEDSGFYRPAMDNVSSFSVASLDELDYEFLLDSVESLATDYVIADISDNRKFSSYYSQLSNTNSGLITGVKAQNIQDAVAKFLNSAMISLKCTEKQAKLKLSAIYDYIIHIENVKGIGFRVDSVMEITSSKAVPLIMNEIVKFVDGVFVLDLPSDFVQEPVAQDSQVGLPLKPSKSFRSRLKS
ncbi:Flp pilus assembly complex ATPase component TadA [bacterium]|nr:Flp pilus assembly complex ATPase component TadA [bacterium]